MKSGRSELKVVLGVKDYVNIQLKTVEHLIFKAIMAKNVEDKVKYLIAIRQLINKCLEALGVDKVEV